APSSACVPPPKTGTICCVSAPANPASRSGCQLASQNLPPRNQTVPSWKRNPAALQRDGSLLVSTGGSILVSANEQVMMCTHLKGKGSWLLPLNQGWNDGAGNPPNPNGLKTDYLWK